MRVGLIEGFWPVQGWVLRMVGRQVLVVYCAAGTMLAGGCLWWVYTAAATVRNEATMKEQWRTIGRPFDEIGRVFGDHETNASAHRLEELAAELGIDVAPRTANGPAEIDPAAHDAFETIKDDVTAQAKRISRSQHRGIPMPPESVRAFVQNHDRQLEAVVEHLLESDAPRWSQRPMEGLDAPLPNLLGEFHLTRLLAVQAGTLIQLGRLEAAAETTEAAWRLQLAAANRPELISQLVGLAEAQVVAGAARCHPDPPEHWSIMLLEHNYRRSILDAFHYDAWSIWDGYRSGRAYGEEGVQLWLMRAASERFLRGQAVFCATAIRTAIEELPTTPFTDYDAGAAFARAAETVVGDRRFASMTLTDVWDSWNRVGSGMLALELSAEAIVLTHRGRAGDEIGASTLASDRPSRLFPSVTWRLTAEGDALRIAPAQDLPPLDSNAESYRCRSFLVELTP